MIETPQVVEIPIFPTGGHALVGRYGDTLRETTSFLQKEVP